MRKIWGTPKGIDLRLGDCLEVMREMENNSVDSIVVDPPYGLKFMSKKWDHSIPAIDVWQECLRVLKPGGFLLSFGGCRTYHRLVCNIEDAGFTIHPMIAWVFGSGFPKATNLSKMIDKAAGGEREVVGSRTADDIRGGNMHACNRGERHEINITAPATPAAKQWDGWFYGLQALKPAIEPICMAQKPYDGKPVDSIQKWQCGALNIDGCRVGTEEITAHGGGVNVEGRKYGAGSGIPAIRAGSNPHSGRHPANLIHDGSDEVVELFPHSTSGAMKGTYKNTLMANNPGLRDGKEIHLQQQASKGSAARFFYCAKANKKDRNNGLEGMEEKPSQKMGDGLKSMVGHPSGNEGNTSSEDRRAKNNHPTVKPLDLMRYLCRLITPPGGVVLDPYMGSGSTGKAAILEGFKFVGIEKEEDYCKIAKRRILDVYKNCL